MREKVNRFEKRRIDHVAGEKKYDLYRSPIPYGSVSTRCIFLSIPPVKSSIIVTVHGFRGSGLVRVNKRKATLNL